MKIKGAFKTVVKDQNRKSLTTIFKEAFHSLLLEKEIPYFYFTSLLYKNGAPDYRNFIGHRAINGILK